MTGDEGTGAITGVTVVTGGDVVTVEDAEILKAKKFLGSKGVYVELTSAAALAGAEKFFANGKPDNYKVVIPMTGSGLKR